MHVFVIDNGSRYSEQLVHLFPADAVTRVGYGEIDRHVIHDDDTLILSGGHGHPVLWHEQEYAQEIELVRRHKGPIIGVCLGFQLIGHIYGSHFHLMSERRKGLAAIVTTQEGESFLGSQQYEVYENHNWAMRTAEPPLLSLAMSSDGVEVVKHQSRPFFAVQFHPEHDSAGGGYDVLVKLATSLGIPLASR